MLSLHLFRFFQAVAPNDGDVPLRT